MKSTNLNKDIRKTLIMIKNSFYNKRKNLSIKKIRKYTNNIKVIQSGFILSLLKKVLKNIKDPQNLCFNKTLSKETLETLLLSVFIISTKILYDGKISVLKILAFFGFKKEKMKIVFEYERKILLLLRYDVNPSLD